MGEHLNDVPYIIDTIIGVVIIDKTVVKKSHFEVLVLSPLYFSAKTSMRTNIL